MPPSSAWNAWRRKWRPDEHEGTQPVPTASSCGPHALKFRAGLWLRSHASGRSAMARRAGARRECRAPDQRHAFPPAHIGPTARSSARSPATPRWCRSHPRRIASMWANGGSGGRSKASASSGRRGSAPSTWSSGFDARGRMARAAHGCCGRCPRRTHARRPYARGPLVRRILARGLWAPSFRHERPLPWGTQASRAGCASAAVRWSCVT